MIKSIHGRYFKKGNIVIGRIEMATFEEVQPLWSEQLWQGRKSPIHPVSSLMPDFTYNLEIYNSAKPIFVKCLYDKRIIAVNSGFQTSLTHYRSRGLWVDKNFRNQGIGNRLLAIIEEQAKKQGCTTLWSLPRESSLPAYLKAGFHKHHIVPKILMEFGPNWLAMKNISDS